jgi:hypothetical protein
MEMRLGSSSPRVRELDPGVIEAGQRLIAAPEDP